MNRPNPASSAHTYLGLNLLLERLQELQSEQRHPLSQSYYLHKKGSIERAGSGTWAGSAVGRVGWSIKKIVEIIPSLA